MRCYLLIVANMVVYRWILLVLIVVGCISLDLFAFCWQSLAVLGANCIDFAMKVGSSAVDKISLRQPMPVFEQIHWILQ